MIDLGYWLSFVAGLFLLVASAVGLRTFVPRFFKAKEDYSKTLALAIIMGFLWTALNTLYWQVFGQVGVALGWLTVTELRLYGSFLDVLFKGLPGVAVLLHNQAAVKSLPKSEQSKWNFLTIALYPNVDHLFVKLWRTLKFRS